MLNTLLWDSQSNVLFEFFSVDPLQTLDICHEIVNMTFCSSDRPFTLKKCSKKRCVDRYDSSESSDRCVTHLLLLF